MGRVAVNQFLPGATRDDLGASKAKIAQTCKRFNTEGRSVHFLRSTWMPSKSNVLSLFDADGADTVQALDPEAGHPYTSLAEAIEVQPSTLNPATRSLIILAGGLLVGWSVGMVVLALAAPSL